MKKLEDLYILNLNKAAMDLDEQITEEMQRLQIDATLELCYVPLSKISPGKIKIAFNNVRSLHKHFKDIEFEPNVLAADVIGFAESRLCKRDENVHFALKGFRLTRLDDKEKESVNWPHHGLAFLSVAWPTGVQLLVFFCSSVPVVLFDTPAISRCRSQHISVESSSLLHHSIYL